jgi:hypothetical protein
VSAERDAVRGVNVYEVSKRCDSDNIHIGQKKKAQTKTRYRTTSTNNERERPRTNEEGLGQE